MSKKSIASRNRPKYLLQWGSLAFLVFFLSGPAGKIFTKSAEVNPDASCPPGAVSNTFEFWVRPDRPAGRTLDRAGKIRHQTALVLPARCVLPPGLPAGNHLSRHEGVIGTYCSSTRTSTRHYRSVSQPR